MMKKNLKLYSTLAVMAMSTMLVTAPCFAETATTTTKATTGTNKSQDGMMKGGYSVLGSKLIGMEVENQQGENLGEVKDIMIDSNGKVRYTAVSYGGVMGMGEKMYAVPLEAFTFKRERDMFYDDVKLILNISQEQLKDQKGFDQNNWPNLDDDVYRRDLDTRYNVNRTGDQNRPATRNP
jgi:sporulation protein YlmC with PRC-barrel domain